MDRRIHLLAVSCIGALAGLMLLTLILTANTPVQVARADSSVSVSIIESGFDPSVVTITAGMTVMWTNHTQETVHLVSGEPYRIYLPLMLRNAGGTGAVAISPPVADDIVAWQQDDWGHVDIAPGESYTHTFATDGKYPYFLARHPDRTGLVVVQRAPTPDFTLGVQPLAQAVMQTKSVTYTVTVTALHGFDSPVALAVGGIPSSATISWATNPLTPTADTALTIKPLMSSPAGTHTLVITGTGGGQVHTTTATMLIVQRPGPEPGHYTGSGPDWSVAFDVTEELQVCRFFLGAVVEGPFGPAYCGFGSSGCVEITDYHFHFYGMDYNASATIDGTFDTQTHAAGWYVVVCYTEPGGASGGGGWDASK